LSARGLLENEAIQVGATSLQRTLNYWPERFLRDSLDADATYEYDYNSVGLPSLVKRNGASRVQTRAGNVLKAGGVEYEFDGLGRTVRRDTLKLAYGPHGHIAKASKGAQTWTYLYDENGERLAKKQAGALVAGYVPEGFIDGSGLAEPIRVGAQVVGLIRNGVFELVRLDPRGTVIAESDGTPRVASPFGERAVQPAVAAAVDYVGKGYDPDLELVRMGVRDYDPKLGRFLTPDPLFLERPEKCLEMSESCNLYSYGRNTPTLYSDPSGENPAVALAILAMALTWENSEKQNIVAPVAAYAAPAAAEAAAAGAWAEYGAPLVALARQFIADARVSGPVAATYSNAPAINSVGTKLVDLLDEPGTIVPRGGGQTLSTVPLPNPGESARAYGTRVHQEFPRLLRETNPGAGGEFNVAPGLTGPDLANPTGMNATFAEMKSLWGRQSPMVSQARNWGFDAQTGRYFFYDRNTGLVFEGIIQTEKFPSGTFR
jgi:RHS repeat-associated protein